MVSRFVKIALVLAAFIIVAGVSTYLTLIFFIKQEDTVVVPDLMGKDVVYVLQILTDIGLNTKVKGSEYSAETPANHVIFQDPKPGVEIKKDRDVRIVISKGTQSVLTPNLKGLSISKARIILEENGLCPGEKSYAYSKAMRKDEIVAHTPASGVTILRNKCVDLLVSNGVRPAAYKMPDLNGRPFEETILMIEAINLRIGDIKPVSRKDKQRNTVVYQDPLPGHRVFEGYRVNLSVTRPPGKMDQEFLNGLAGVHLFRYRLQNGFLKRRIHARLNSFGGAIDLFDDFLKPGEEIWLLIPKNSSASLFLYEDGDLITSQVYDEWQIESGFERSDFRFQTSALDFKNPEPEP